MREHGRPSGTKMAENENRAVAFDSNILTYFLEANNGSYALVARLHPDHAQRTVHDLPVLPLRGQLRPACLHDPAPRALEAARPRPTRSGGATGHFARQSERDCSREASITASIGDAT